MREQEMNQGQGGMNQWKCEKCGASFTNQEELDKHNSIHVEEEETSKAGAGGTGGARGEMEGGGNREMS